MNKETSVAAFAGMTLLFCGCALFGYSHDTTPPQVQQNFAELNTPWDDYNASAPWGTTGPVVWSTSRGTKGAQFDIWIAQIRPYYEPKYHLNVVAAPPEQVRKLGAIGHAAAPPHALLGADSPGNKFGPILLPSRPGAPAENWRENPNYGGGPLGSLIFASDRPGGKGGLDLYQLDLGQDRSGASTATPMPLEELNSSGNDSYWSYAGEGHPAAYFASDRGGHGYKIYEIRWKEGDKPAPFGGPGAEVRMVPELAGDGDDTAPYLFWRQEKSEKRLHMVFASKRSGGQGGWDLWCSRYGKDGWEKPRSLGPRVNSPKDEFRPSVTDEKLMIFSSNRPGGKGGFDLYYAKFISPY
jgi:hypothetical protein